MCSRSDKSPSLGYSKLAGAWKVLLAAALLVLAGCQPDTDTTTLPAPETWRVQVTPALRWLGPVFNECTRQSPGIALLYDEEPASALDLDRADFALSFSQPVKDAGYTAILAQVNVAVIVNPTNPVLQLNRTSLEAIYGGKAVAWADVLQKDCPGCASFAKNGIKPYVYGEGDDFGLGFSDLFPGLSLRVLSAVLAPDPEAVRQAVASDPQAVGIIPVPTVDSSVRQVAINDVPADHLRVPLLLSTPSEPAGAKRSWVLCVQQKIP